MTDRDIIERAATLLRGHVYALPEPPPARPWKRQWRAYVKGPRAAGWMMTIYPLLGQRRRGQVRQALSKWRAMPYVRISPIIERSIVEAWTAGGTTKLALARRLGVSRGTIYSVLERSGDGVVMEGGFRCVTPIDIAWLAGLVEGEGNISINGRSFTIRVKMGDHDIVERAAALLGGRLYPIRAPRAGRKAMWLTQIKGATAAGWAMTLYPWLGLRRRQQVRDALAHWRRQGNGVVNAGLADAILTYRTARFSQSEIMALLKIGKSTVYRHTRRRLPRVRVTRQQQAARGVIDQSAGNA
jgi:DNA-binding CsgD family transcriptional regulator